MELSLKEQDSITVLAIAGRLDAMSAPKLKETFNSALQQNINFVFDMSQTEFIDSVGLGSIVACLKSSVVQDGNIKIAELQAKPRMVFEITRAYKIFDIFDDTDTAVKSFNED